MAQTVKTCLTPRGEVAPGRRCRLTGGRHHQSQPTRSGVGQPQPSRLGPEQEWPERRGTGAGREPLVLLVIVPPGAVIPLGAVVPLGAVEPQGAAEPPGAAEPRPETSTPETPKPGPHPSPEGLSRSEERVLRYLPTHLSAPAIARELYLSVNTVKTHIHHVYVKLGVSSRAEAVGRARSLGLLAA